ncbi:MAG: LysR family transcriptional regulator [Ruminococcaceae bacterium]|nr:LysR family transcriptional regulator [Oscillospiraceae bacterium]
MELLQLRYFCDAAELENFSRTAEKHGVPVSNISQTIKRLERELGCELFIHAANRIMLNEQGRLFFDSAKKALGSLEEGRIVLAESKNSVAGEIKILVLTNRRVVTRAIEDFKQKYPEVTFVIKHNTGTSGEFDLIICDEYFPDADFDTTVLLTEDILLAVHKDNPLARRDTIAVGELKNERFITMPDGSSMYTITNRLCEGFVPNIAIQSDDPYYIRKYVAMGLGVAFFPEMSWHGQFSDDVVFKSIGTVRRSTVIARKKGKYLTRRAKLFIEMLKTAVEETKPLQMK